MTATPARLLLAVVVGLLLAACQTSPPTLPPTESGVVIFEDDFSTNTGLWTEANDAGDYALVTQGLLIINVTTINQVVLSLTNFTLQNFDMRVRATQMAGPNDNGYGVIFGYTGPDSLYRFDIAGDGYWGVSRYQSGAWQPIVVLTQHSAISPGAATNDLRIVSDAGTVWFYCNEQLLGNALLNVPEGRVGVFASTFDAPDVQVAFDNVIVTAVR